MNKFLTAVIFFTASFFVNAQKGQRTIYMDNTNKEGVLGQSFIHMHNKKGVRIELNLSRQKLALWISPLAGKSLKGSDRNFSNRDDHTSIFDFIGFPNLPYEDFIRCDYDPFYSKVYFKNNTLHILAAYNSPSVIVWFDKADQVDLKSDKQDKMLRRETKVFELSHPDRGKNFSFVAELGKGAGKIDHQKVLDEGRSVYARCYLEAGQPLIISGDESSENVATTSSTLAAKELNSIIKENEKQITDGLFTGRIKVKNNADLQKIIDLNRRIILAMQDESGAMRAALRHIYYLIWHRDGGMVFSYNAYTGWAEPLKKWVEYILANPTVNEKGERYFAQLVSPITKLEEDGPFYGIWSFFTYYTQTGDSSLNTSYNLKVLEDNIGWMENNYFDSAKGLFFRYHYGESPFYNSPGDGYDDAVGNANNKNVYKWKGDTISKAYDTYVNSIMYSNYMMLSVVEKGAKKTEYLEKAAKLAKKLEPYYQVKGKLPDYGELIDIKGKSIMAEATGPDEADYQWGFGLPFFYPNYENLAYIRNSISDEILNKPHGQFLASWFSNVASLDPETYSVDKIKKAILYIVPQTTTSGSCLPMPYAIPEIVDVEDCNIFHDVRPQPFSISAYLASVGNLGVRRYPFGLAVRGTDFLDKIENYSYKGKLIDFIFTGKGNTVGKVKVNGKLLRGTFQIPESWLNLPRNKVEIEATGSISSPNVLIGSTVSVEKVYKNGFEVSAFGKNVLFFKNLNGKPLVTDQTGKSVVFTTTINNGISYLEFEGLGKYKVSIK